MDKIKELLAEISVYCNAATPGPWETNKTGLVVTAYSIDPCEDAPQVIAVPPVTSIGDADGQFIVKARTYLPTLRAVAEEILELCDNPRPSFYEWPEDKPLQDIPKIVLRDILSRHLGE